MDRIKRKPAEVTGPTCKFNLGGPDSVIEKKGALLPGLGFAECNTSKGYISRVFGGKCLSKTCPTGSREVGKLMRDLCIADKCPENYQACASFLCISPDSSCTFTIAELAMGEPLNVGSQGYSFATGTQKTIEE